MPRPTKCRRVCALPRCTVFHGNAEGESVSLSVEEFETIRLIDYLGLNQEECAEQMEVARTTVQRIYNEARQKLSIFLVEGSSLSISGGTYILNSDKCGKRRGCPKCPKHKNIKESGKR
ncbi:MAG: DUF134 domain-containing protein [Bacillota bacterium]|nr:DUF134 domain-containing protein [Bacillota bacterium]